jgi:hypothetical protein
MQQYPHFVVSWRPENWDARAVKVSTPTNSSGSL